MHGNQRRAAATPTSTAPIHTFAICAHGESAFLEACLASIAQQELKQNAIVCTSTPNSHVLSLAEKYGFPLFVNPRNTNMQESWNYAMECAETNFVTICHQDDVYEPDYLSTVLPYLTDDTLFAFTDNYDLVNGQRTCGVTTKIRRILAFPLRSRLLQKSVFCKRLSMSFGNVVCCPTCVYNQSARQKPYFRSKLQHSLDWDLYVDFAMQKGAAVYIPKALVGKRIHDASSTTQDIQDGIRYHDDKIMFERLWCKPIASLILAIYAKIYR